MHLDTSVSRQSCDAYSGTEVGSSSVYVYDCQIPMAQTTLSNKETEHRVTKDQAMASK
jgi:hypothetical protein